MRSVSISELKAKLSEHLRRVRNGDRLVITDRGKVVAGLVPAREVDEDARIQDLIDRGLMRPPRDSSPLPDEFWDMPRAKDPEGLGLKYLLEDRESGW
jgi:prevent-host-death family protein